MDLAQCIDAETDTTDQQRVLHACQELCRMLAQEALTRIAASIDPESTNAYQTYLVEQREALEQWLTELGAPL